MISFPPDPTTLDRCCHLASRTAQPEGDDQPLPKQTGQETAHRRAQVSSPGLVTSDQPFLVAPHAQVSTLPASQGLEESLWRMGNPEGRQGANGREQGRREREECSRTSHFLKWLFPSVTNNVPFLSASRCLKGRPTEDGLAKPRA